MRLFEITRPKLYLGLAEPMKTGDIVERQDGAHPLGAPLEGRLEARRPEDCLPRDRSLYLMLTPSGSAPHIYEIEPIGQLDRHHTGWLQRLAQAPRTSTGELDQYALGYWSGVEIPELRDEPWEYRCLQAKVIQRVDGTDLT